MVSNFDGDYNRSSFEYIMSFIRVVGRKTYNIQLKRGAAVEFI